MDNMKQSVSFLDDDRGQTEASNMASRAVGLVVALMVGGLVSAFLLPIAISEIVGVTTTDWSSGATALWGIMDVIIVLALFLFFIGIALAATNSL